MDERNPFEEYKKIKHLLRIKSLREDFDEDTKKILNYLNSKICTNISELSAEFVDLTPEVISESVSKLNLFGIIKMHNDKIFVNHEIYSEYNHIIHKLKRHQKQKNHSKKSKSSYDEIEDLLNYQTFQEKQDEKLNKELIPLLENPTFNEKMLNQIFISNNNSIIRRFCKYRTTEKCLYHRSEKSNKKCKYVHLKRVIQKHTDMSVGDCSFLNACFHSSVCKYVHYEIDKSYLDQTPEKLDFPKIPILSLDRPQIHMFPPQWVKCDLRFFNLSVLGKFDVIMADPAWDIHMELPYGTLGDSEMMNLPIPDLQDDGFIFLWVTGRAMELGRECLKLWGYNRCDEIIWVKVNQLQRLIRTGRTGHWLNHGKEHCLVGIKGDPKGYNKFLDCDVIVSEVRDTSHKPDEIYGIIERMWPNSRKIELFGRQHNCQPNWTTLGNQLDGVRLYDPDTIERFKKAYPNGYKF